MLKSKQTNFGCSDKKKWKKNEDLDSPEGIIPTTGHDGHHSWFLDHHDCLISSWAATGVQLTGESKIQYTTVRNVPKQRGVWMPTLPRAARSGPVWMALHLNLTIWVQSWCQSGKPSVCWRIQEDINIFISWCCRCCFWTCKYIYRCLVKGRSLALSNLMPKS